MQPLFQFRLLAHGVLFVGYGDSLRQAITDAYRSYREYREAIR